MLFRSGSGLLVVPARPVPGPRAALSRLKAGLVEIYGGRFKGAYVYDASVFDVRVVVVLDHVDDYGAEIERTGDLVAELSLASAIGISRVFLPEQDWVKRRRAGARPL